MLTLVWNEGIVDSPRKGFSKKKSTKQKNKNKKRAKKFPCADLALKIYYHNDNKTGSIIEGFEPKSWWKTTNGIILLWTALSIRMNFKCTYVQNQLHSENTASSDEGTGEVPTIRHLASTRSRREEFLWWWHFSFNPKFMKAKSETKQAAWGC